MPTVLNNLGFNIPSWGSTIRRVLTCFGKPQPCGRRLLYRLEQEATGGLHFVRRNFSRFFFLIHSISVIFFASVAWLMSSSIPHSKLLLTALTPIKTSKQIFALQVSTMVFKNTPQQSAASVPGHQNFELNLDKCEL